MAERPRTRLVADGDGAAHRDLDLTYVEHAQTKAPIFRVQRVCACLLFSDALFEERRNAARLEILLAGCKGEERWPLILVIEVVSPRGDAPIDQPFVKILPVRVGRKSAPGSADG
jgi:hypothetical protein